MVWLKINQNGKMLYFFVFLGYVLGKLNFRNEKTDATNTGFFGRIDPDALYSIQNVRP
jgi:hypothetical protein